MLSNHVFGKPPTLWFKRSRVVGTRRVNKITTFYSMGSESDTLPTSYHWQTLGKGVLGSASSPNSGLGCQQQAKGYSYRTKQTRVSCLQDIPWWVVGAPPSKGSPCKRGCDVVLCPGRTILLLLCTWLGQRRTSSAMRESAGRGWRLMMMVVVCSGWSLNKMQIFV